MASDVPVSINGKSFTLSYEIYPGGETVDSFSDVPSRMTAQRSTGQNIYNSYSAAARAAVTKPYAEDADAASIMKYASPRTIAYSMYKALKKNIYFFTLKADKVEKAPAVTGDLLLPEHLESFLDRKRARFTIQKDDGEESYPILDSAEIMIDNFQIGDKERVHVMQCFDDIHVQSFGRGAMFASLSGYLLHAENAQWFHKFMVNYDKYLRASKAIESSAKFVLDVDGKILQGQLLSVNVSQAGGSPKSIPFTIQMVVYKINYVGFGEVSTIDPIPKSLTPDDKQESTEAEKKADATTDKSPAGDAAPAVNESDRIWNIITKGNLIAAAGVLVSESGANASQDTDQTTQKDSNTAAEDPAYPVGATFFLNGVPVEILSSTLKDNQVWVKKADGTKMPVFKSLLSTSSGGTYSGGGGRFGGGGSTSGF